MIAQHGVQALFTAPTAFRAIKKEDPDGAHLAPVRPVAVRVPVPRRRAPRPGHATTGPRDLLGVPVIDHWWQTETGWPIAANCIGIEPLPVKPGSPTKPVPGYDVRVLDEDGRRVAAGRRRRDRDPAAAAARDAADAVERRRALRASRTSSAFPGYYLTGDGGHVDEDGYLYVMGRIDDVINVAGHRLSTGAMEEVIAAHPDVAECAVIGVADELQGPGARSASWC